MGTDVVVVGAGVSGLTTAVCLLEAGAAVSVRTAGAPIGTTSAVAGAMIGPVAAADDEVQRAWSALSDRTFRELAGEPGAGVAVRRGRLLTTPGYGAALPPWAAAVPGFEPLTGDELPAGYLAGMRAELPFVDMPVYLSWLMGRVRSLGGEVRWQPVSAWSEVAGDGEVVVNCAGLGAARLAGDEGLVPVLGQHVIVDCPSLDEFVYEGGAATDWLSVMPHGRRVVVGGVARRGVADLTPDPEITAAILARARAAVPALADAPVSGVEVGLRPGRRAPRVEVEEVDGIRVVHNYGHAGNGVMLSWGCAADAARLALA
jgi:D-amino-acid oxidase